MTIGTTIAIIFLLIANACLSAAYINLGNIVDDLIEIFEMKKDFDVATLQSIKELKNRVAEIDEIAKNARSRTRDLEKKLERGVIYEGKR